MPLCKLTRLRNRQLWIKLVLYWMVNYRTLLLLLILARL